MGAGITNGWRRREGHRALSAPEATAARAPQGSGQCSPGAILHPLPPTPTAPWREIPAISPCEFPLPEARFQPLGKGRREEPVLGPSPATWRESPAAPTGSGTQGWVGARASPPPEPTHSPPPLPRTRRRPRAPSRTGARPPTPPPLPGTQPRPARTRAAPGPTRGGRGQARPARARSPRPAAPAPGALPGDGRLRASGGPRAAGGGSGAGPELRRRLRLAARAAPPLPRPPLRSCEAAFRGSCAVSVLTQQPFVEFLVGAKPCEGYKDNSLVHPRLLCPVPHPKQKLQLFPVLNPVSVLVTILTSLDLPGAFDLPRLFPVLLFQLSPTLHFLPLLPFQCWSSMRRQPLLPPSFLVCLSVSL